MSAFSIFSVGSHLKLLAYSFRITDEKNLFCSAECSFCPHQWAITHVDESLCPGVVSNGFSAGRATEFMIKFPLPGLYALEENCLILNGSYYHCPEKALDDKSKLVIVTTVMICTRFCVEFQNVCSVLQPIDQRIIACQGLCTLTDSSCVLAYFCLFESFSCFSHYSLFTWVLQTDWSFQIWRNICFYRWWLFVRCHSPHELVTSVRGSL